MGVIARTISSFMTLVFGSSHELPVDVCLSNQVMCPQVKMPKRDENRCVAKRIMEEQKEELDEVTQELVETEHENTILRRNIERIKEEKDLSM